MTDAGPSITMVIPTIGRMSLEITLRSFLVQKRVPGDRVVLLCDGWDGEVSVEDPAIEVRRLPKRGNFGHDHIYEALNDGVPGDYVVTGNDDDAWLPWAYHAVRPLLDGRFYAFPFYLETGEIRKYIFFKDGGPIPVRGGRHGQVMHGKVAGLGAFIPNERPFSRFGVNMHSDGDFFRAEAEKREAVLVPYPLALYYAPLASKVVWERLGMGEVMAWSPEFVKARGPRAV